MLSKTDFLRYMEAPMHLWAAKNDQIERGPSTFDQHLMHQGSLIEELALEYLRNDYLVGNGEISTQVTFEDGSYLVRVDAALADPDGEWVDIYEVKSSTSIKKEHYYDLTFQGLVIEASQPVRDLYLVYVNKEYVQGDEMDLKSFFLIENLNEEIEKRRAEVLQEREFALAISEQVDPAGISTCYHPRSCPSPALCHGELPDYSIYNLPRLGARRAQDLRSQGVTSIREIPPGYDLTEKQELHLQSVISGEPLINQIALRNELEALQFPLYFLDYETYAPGIPLFPGYKPYEHLVFQYSLHRIEAPGAEPTHEELLLTEKGDPGQELARDLLEKIGDQGSVLVWNKGFEMGKNKEMAERYPAYRNGLLGVNERVYDLMTIFSNGYYVHPDFGGSASLKAVLPVVIPEFKNAYEDLPISGGEQAMLVWADIQAGKIPEGKIPQIREELLAYCKLDTLAMVEIHHALRSL